MNAPKRKHVGNVSEYETLNGPRYTADCLCGWSSGPIPFLSRERATACFQTHRKSVAS